MNCEWRTQNKLEKLCKNGTELVWFMTPKFCEVNESVMCVDLYDGGARSFMAWLAVYGRISSLDIMYGREASPQPQSKWHGRKWSRSLMAEVHVLGVVVFRWVCCGLKWVSEWVCVMESCKSCDTDSLAFGLIATAQETWFCKSCDSGCIVA